MLHYVEYCTVSVYSDAHQGQRRGGYQKVVHGVLYRTLQATLDAALLGTEVVVEGVAEAEAEVQDGQSDDEDVVGLDVSPPGEHQQTQPVAQTAQPDRDPNTLVRDEHTNRSHNITARTRTPIQVKCSVDFRHFGLNL